ncbi:MAG: hypothetical protein H6698_03420 [Myxococcales bacterium]|nr:hypothetical protein [Myxococcales bacterium]MCB9519299.1 hypothetical protein [Myxococcales bacterium]MCB9530743.1 hypothetical protein [Myxococcales bacterium]MCB9533363.1 hypothetical protein [Myxococcales bacterium]
MGTRTWRASVGSIGVLAASLTACGQYEQASAPAAETASTPSAGISITAADRAALVENELFSEANLNGIRVGLMAPLPVLNADSALAGLQVEARDAVFVRDTRTVRTFGVNADDAVLDGPLYIRLAWAGTARPARSIASRSWG